MGVRGISGLLAVAILAGCQTEPLATPDPAAIPSGSLGAQGAAAIGPMFELGSGSTAGIGWRYAIFESEDGWCTQLETQSATTTRTECGLIPLEEGLVFGSVFRSGPVVDGVVSDETATVFLIIDSLGRVPATLMALDAAGLEGHAFVGIAPADANVTHVMAVKLNGEILETYELP
jgi:hypothetical protein